MKAKASGTPAKLAATLLKVVAISWMIGLRDDTIAWAISKPTRPAEDRRSQRQLERVRERHQIERVAQVGVVGEREARRSCCRGSCPRQRERRHEQEEP
jgi:hypothetical protein